MVIRFEDKDSRFSDTYLFTNTISRREEEARRKYERVKETKEMMMRFLEKYGEVPLKFWNGMLAWSRNTALSCEEIFKKAEEWMMEEKEKESKK